MAKGGCFHPSVPYKSGIPQSGNLAVLRLFPGLVREETQMKGWRCFGSLTVVAILFALGGGVTAQGDKDQMEWKCFDEKAGPFYQVLTTETTQTMTVQTMEVKQKQNQTF